MKKFIFITTLLSSLLLARECPDEFSPDKFTKALYFFEDLIEENFKEVSFFGTKEEFETLAFVKKDEYFYKKDSYTKRRSYTYPIVMGFWKYKLDSNKNVYEINIA